MSKSSIYTAFFILILIMKLGCTNLDTSKICFGTLTTSKLQRNFSKEKTAELFLYGFNNGINFFDTAELYDNYNALRLFLREVPREKAVISTKCYAYNIETAKKSLYKALEEMQTPYIDIFMLHEQESIHTIRGHFEAIEYFMKAKEKGLIKHFGISTHYIEGVNGALKTDEIEIIHPIVNKLGIGLRDGTNDRLFDSLQKAKMLNKTIFAMKPLGGGHLIGKNKEAISYVCNLPFVDAIAIGMQSKEEIDKNVLFINENIDDNIAELSKKNRSIHIADWCIKCGKCAEKCGQNAMYLGENKMQIDKNKCIYCGYCASVCPEFCIKVY